MGIFMKWDKSIIPVGKLPLRFLFLIGFAVGVLIVYWGKGTFLKNMGMLNEDTLYHMKYMAVDNKVSSGTSCVKEAKISLHWFSWPRRTWDCYSAVG